MYEVICVGSSTVDVFVETAQKELRKHHDHLDACYAVGSKQLVKSLHTTTGGGGTNAAVSFSRLGFRTGLISAVGDDLHADSILNVLTDEKVKFLGAHKKGHSGYSVILTHVAQDRCILAYKGVNNQLSMKDVSFPNTKWVYLSSLMGKSFETARKIVRKCKTKKIPYAFNPSSYLAKKGIKNLKPLISGCSLLVLNEEEAQMLCQKKCSPRTSLKTLQKHASIVVITRGAKGALAYDGEHLYDLHAKKDKVVETTGAGDSFATAVVAGLMMGKSLEDSLRLGYAQSTSVILHVGAKQGLLSKPSLLRRAKKQKIRVIKTKM